MARQDITQQVSEAIRNMIGLMLVGRTRVSLDFGSAAVNVALQLTITVTGALLGDFAHWGAETVPDALLQVTAQISAADTVQITIQNDVGGAIDPAATLYITQVFRSTET